MTQPEYTVQGLLQDVREYVGEAIQCRRNVDLCNCNEHLLLRRIDDELTAATPAPDADGDAEYKQCGWFLSGPHATNLVITRDEIEEDIARMCKLTGDDPDDYTATPVYVKFVKWPDIKAALANPPQSAGETK